jgi:glycosyltransferase involved in cell wall biosynthesis
MVAALAERATLKVVDLSAPPGASGPTKYAVRLFRAFKAVRTVLFHGANRRVLYMQLDGDDGLVLNILIAAAARLRGFRAYLHHHSFAYINRRSWLMNALIGVAPKGSCHVALCEEMGAQLAQVYAPAWRRSQARQLVAPNAFLLPAPVAQEGAAAPRPLTLCHLSNLTAAKGALAFLKLFDRLRAAGVEVRAKVGGPATEPAVEAALRRAEADHADSFEWRGPVYGAAKADLLAACDLFVFPTAYVNEAQPVVLLEALAAGLPILAIRRGCIGCDFDEGVGLIADSSESFPYQAFEWVRALADDPQRLRQYQTNALATAATKRDEAVAQLEMLLTELTRS